MLKQPKYEIDQEVVSKDGEVCKVLKMSFNGEGWSYTVSSVEVDTKHRKLVDGVKNVLESELSAKEK